MQKRITESLLLLAADVPWPLIGLFVIVSSPVLKKLGKFLWEKFVQALKKLGKFLWKKFAQAIANEINEINEINKDSV